MKKFRIEYILLPNEETQNLRKKLNPTSWLGGATYSKLSFFFDGKLASKNKSGNKANCTDAYWLSDFVSDFSHNLISLKEKKEVEVECFDNSWYLTFKLVGNKVHVAFSWYPEKIETSVPIIDFYQEILDFLGRFLYDMDLISTKLKNHKLTKQILAEKFIFQSQLKDIVIRETLEKRIKHLV